MEAGDQAADAKLASFPLALSVAPTSKTPDVKVSMRISKMREDEKMSLRSFEKLALARIADHSEWLIEEPTSKAMAASIRSTEYGKVRGQPTEDGKYGLVSYQPKIASEPATTPHLRIPPLRNSASMPGGAHYT